MILLIDNYDSFVYNLYQFIAEIEPDVKVVRNDEITSEEILKMNPGKIVISPGPGKPSEAGECIHVIRELKGKIPILGVCLGHQAIAEAFGATVGYAKHLMHGKTSLLEDVDTDSLLFRGLEKPVQVARYHSLAVEEDTLPKELKVTARKISNLWCTVSPGVSYDTERIYDDKKLYRKAVNYADTGGAEND